VYAIVRSGGKQYRVAQGETIYVERLETPVGQQVKLADVLMVGGEEDGKVRVGVPFLDKVAVLGTVVEQARDHKIRVFKYKKRKHYRRTRGHRQSYTALKIDSIELGA
jgi:large subunit ribosomal protein L21